MFYNEDRKQKYLEECKTYYSEETLKFVESVFNNCADVESQEKMDLCEFNRKQIVNLLKKFNYKSIHTLKTSCSFLSRYYAWCHNEGLIQTSTVNYYDLSLSNAIIDEVLTKDILKDKYITRQRLYDYMDKIYDVSDRFILYAFFSGLTKEDLINLTIEDLNKEEKVITVISGRKINVDDRFIELMLETNSKQYYEKDGIVSKKKDNFLLAESKYVLKKQARYGGDQITTMILHTRMTCIKDQIMNRLININSIQLCGLVDYIKQKLNAKDVTLETAFEHMYYDEIQIYINEFGALNLTSRMLKMKIINYLDIL